MATIALGLLLSATVWLADHLRKKDAPTGALVATQESVLSLAALAGVVLDVLAIFGVRYGEWGPPISLGTVVGIVLVAVLPLLNERLPVAARAARGMPLSAAVVASFAIQTKWPYLADALTAAAGAGAAWGVVHAINELAAGEPPVRQAAGRARWQVVLGLR